MQEVEEAEALQPEDDVEGVEAHEDQPERGGRVLPAPRTPSRAEREAHDVTHMPYRSWCRFCVMGRGVERRHEARPAERDADRPKVHVDYAYLSGDSTPVLVAKDRRTGLTFAAAVSRKGGGDPHAARLLARWIDALGCQEVTIRTDGESCVKELVKCVREMRATGTTTVLETSPPGDSAANGTAERANGIIGGLVRTLKAEVEQRALGGRVAGPRLVAWMVQHAAHLHNVCTSGEDGLTPFRRWKGRNFATPLAGFGERVLLREPPLEKVAKHEPRWRQARLLGYCLHSSRYIVVDFNDKIVLVRTVKRAEEQSRWAAEEPADPFFGEDLNVTPSEHQCEGAPRADVRPAAPRPERAPAAAPDLPPDHEPAARRVYLRQEDFIKHGTSPHCPGCRALTRGGRAQAHSEACRVRLEGELEKSERGRARLAAAATRSAHEPERRAAKKARLVAGAASEGDMDMGGQALLPRPGSLQLAASSAGTHTQMAVHPVRGPAELPRAAATFYPVRRPPELPRAAASRPLVTRVIAATLSAGA